MLYLTLLLTAGVVVADDERAATWDFCGCYWDTWESWSTCDSSCFGRRSRSRSVWFKNKDGCGEFEQCAKPGSGWQHDVCNGVCDNGGTVRDPDSFFWPCSCTSAYTGKCCRDRIICGHPGDISNGRVTFTNSYYYDSAAKYSCASNYRMTSGSSRRICQSSAVWSGSKPTCSYNHCTSNPCRNKATCTNLINDYSCSCKQGWSGKRCEIDIQPPVLYNCPGDIKRHASKATVTVEWTAPTFVDPMGRHLEITSNYVSPAFDFPWGDFEVQYTALKPSNGLRTRCLFKIIIRPTPCKPLNVPLNGALVCNKWATEFGKLCFMACQKGFTIDNPGVSYTHWYVCGARGIWIPSPPLQDCSLGIPADEDILNYQPDYTRHSFRSCDESASVTALQQFYIKKLKTGKFVDFCKRYPAECKAENVAVQCNNDINM